MHDCFIDVCSYFSTAVRSFILHDDGCTRRGIWSGASLHRQHDSLRRVSARTSSLHVRLHLHRGLSHRTHLCDTGKILNINLSLSTQRQKANG